MGDAEVAGGVLLGGHVGGEGGVADAGGAVGILLETKIRGGVLQRSRVSVLDSPMRYCVLHSSTARPPESQSPLPANAPSTQVYNLRRRRPPM